MSDNGNFDVMKKAITAVITDETFLISENGQKAQLCATRLLEWMVETQDNKKRVLDFTNKLICDLQVCFKHPRKVKCHTLRERMWEKYYKLRASDKFKDDWTDFIHSTVGLRACPTLYQYVTNVLMEGLIKDEFPVQDTSGSVAISKTTLDTEETNAIHYTAGYVIRSLTRELTRTPHPHKDELLMCLQEMTEDNDESGLDCAKWTELVDRGGLIKVGDVTYTIFALMELEFRRNFDITSSAILKRTFHQKLLDNEELSFYWCLLSVNWGEESRELLQLISSKWLTIRGFSSASAFIEMYKKTNKKTVQKLKALRKNLIVE